MREHDTPLIDACRHGRIANVLALLSAGVDVNQPKTDGRGATPLFIAAQHGHMQVIDTLLAAGADADRPIFDGGTPLYMAAQEGHVAAVVALLGAGARVDGGRRAGGGTPLFIASLQGNVEVMAVLLAAGAHADVAVEGRTPVFWASQHGQTDVLTALLAAGACVEGAERSDGATPLVAAAINGHAETIAALLAAGAEVDPILRQPREGDDALDDTATPLFLACIEGHADVVCELLTAGAAIDWSARDDRITPLMVASQQGHIEVATALLEAGAAFHSVDAVGRTAMSLACGNGQLACAQLLSSYGAPRIFMMPSENRTAEGVATEEGHEAVAAWLGESRQWSTPLHHLRIIAVARARELLRGGADIHAATSAGGPTPLSLARALRAAGDPDADEGSAASLVLAAAEPWGPRTHALFPDAARSFAVEVLLLGHQLSRQPKFAGEEVSLVDVWTQLVMPSAVVRRPIRSG